MKASYDPIRNKWSDTPVQNLAKHDVVFRSPVCDPTYGLPIGDGDTGCLIHLNEYGLMLNFNKTDLWDDCADSSSLFCTDRDEELTSLRHGGKLNIDFSAPVFELIYQKEYEARLSLSDAVAQISTRTAFSDINFKAFACHAARVTVVECEVNTPEPMPISIGLERWGSRNLWRWYSQMRKDYDAGLDGTGTISDNGTIGICQQLRNTAFCLLVQVVSECDHSEKRLHSRKCEAAFKPDENISFKLYITLETGETLDEAMAGARSNLAAAVRMGSDELYNVHREEWREFWSRSFVKLENDYLENLWYLNLYYANSECRGNYPQHFCNGIWSFYHDFVPWNYYFHYNMQLHTFPLNAANHPELLEGYYNLMRRRLPEAERFCERVKGVKGAFYTDVYDRNGKNDRHTIDNCSCGAQTAMSMWMHYLYTGDLEFLRSKALPVMKSAGEFYKNIVAADKDGIYHVYGTQAYEGTPLMDDSITDMSMIRALFGALVQVLPQDEAEEYQKILNNLPPYKLLPLEDDEFDGECLIYGIGKGSGVNSSYILGVGRDKDSGQWLRKDYGNPEHESFYGFPDTEMAPVFPSGVVGVGDRGSELYNTLVNQVRIHPEVKPPRLIDIGNMAGTKGMCMGWCLAPIYLARLGLGHELAAHLEQYVSTWIAFPQGFGSYGPYEVFTSDNNLRWKKNNVHDVDSGKITHVPAWNFRHFDYESLPIIATAINEMLLQSYDGVIRLFPALCSGSAAAFNLAAVGGFSVNAETDGSDFVAGIESKLGGVCSVALSCDKVHCYRIDNGAAVKAGYKSQQAGGETIISLVTQKGERLVLSSCELCNIELCDVPAASPNQDVKRLGSSKLGEERMF